MDHQRVLHVIWSARLGGIARIVLALCEYQREHRMAHSDILVCMSDGELKENFVRAGIGFHELGLQSGKDINPVKLAHCLRLMKRYDTIHMHIFNPVVGFSAMLSNKKIVFTEHGNFGLGRSTGISGRIVQHLKSRFLNRSGVIITCNSQFTARTLSRLNRIPENQLNIVYNGLSEKEEKNGKPNTWKKKDEFLIVGIGRLAAVKRFDRVIESFRKAAIENSRLLIMGEGPELTNLRKIMPKQDGGPAIELIGAGDSRSLLREADLCIIGSQGEAFGLVAVEAYQAGKRVLVYEDGGGVTEITGEFDPESVCRDNAAMAEQIRITQESDRFLNPEWAEKARRHAGEFSMKKMAEAFNRLYQS